MSQSARGAGRGRDQDRLWLVSDDDVRGANAGDFMLLALLMPSALMRWLDFVHFAPGIRPRSCRGVMLYF